MRRARPLVVLLPLLAACAGSGATARETSVVDGNPVALDDGWATSTLETEGIDGARMTRLAGRIARDELGGLDSLLVVRNGRLCYEAYYRGGREVLHELQSVTKSVTSALVGAALLRGLLCDLQQPVASVLPSFAAAAESDPAKRDIRLVHLLTMSAGLDWDESWPYTDARNTLARMNESRDWEAYVLSRRAIEAPGARFVYNSGGVILLGAVIRALTGGDVAAFAEAAIFAPLRIRGARWTRSVDRPELVHPGAVVRVLSSEDVSSFADSTLLAPLGIRSARWIRNPYRPEQVHTGGGLSLRARDQAKIGQLYLAGGTWAGERVLGAEFIEESTKPRLPAWDAEYGYLWWLRTTGGNLRVVEAWGTRGQHVFIVDALRLVVVVNGHADQIDSGRAVLDEIVAAASRN